MSCLYPRTGYFSREIGSSGKRGITFQRNASFSGVGMKLPCGQCIECRLDYARQWAVRMVHEQRMHADSSFITVTYDKENLPEGGTLVV